MLLSDEIKNKIFEEFNSFKEKQYANKTEKERKELNQFFTPPELTIKMLEKFENLDGTIIDPCCGAGNLIMAAAIAKNSPEQVYGFDIDPKMIELSKERFQNYFNLNSFNNITNQNSTIDWKENYSLAITNPPFNKNGANLIELEIIKQIISHTNNSVILCTLTNITDICGPLKQGKKYIKYKNVLNGKLNNIETIKNSSSYFNIDLAKDLGILTINKNSVKNYDDFRFIKNEKNYKFLYDKIYSKVVENNLGINKHWSVVSNEFSVPLKVLVSANNYNIITFGLKSINSNVNYKPSKSIKTANIKVAKVLNFNSQQEVNNFYNSVMNKFFFFLVKHCLTSQNIKNTNKFLPYMSDYSHVWTNEMYYDYFNLTETERKLIEEEMEDYISKIKN